VGSTSAALRASFRVLRQNKQLIVFPAVALPTEAVLLAGFVALDVASTHSFSAAAQHFGVGQYILLALAYLVLTTVSTYFNVALFIATATAMRGERPDVRSALREATRRLPTILAWSALASTISLLLQVIERRIPIANLFLSISWGCLSFLMLPVMVYEGVGIRRAARRSTELFRTVWREEVVGSLRLGGITLLLAIPAAVVLFFGLAAGTESSIILAACICALWFGLCALVMSCLTSVFRVAVYQYATTQTTPPQFDGYDLSRAFIPRRRRY
jgi:hypothetical protein